jgi:hypothetical protein
MGSCHFFLAHRSNFSRVQVALLWEHWEHCEVMGDRVDEEEYWPILEVDEVALVRE